QVFNTFNARTRTALQQDTDGLGTGLAGRGESINTAIGAFKPLLRDIVPVMQNLSSPRTNIRGFFTNVERTMSILAPAAETQASLFRGIDTTMNALRQVARPYIQQSITRRPPAVDA